MRQSRYKTEKEHHQADLENFWKKVDKKDDDSCWLWTATRDGNKKQHKQYGVFCISRDGKKITHKAHRYSWEIANNQTIPKGMYICHHCDNPKCVNPKHLFLGTPKDNARDRDLKERSGSAKLNWESVRAIRKECNLLEIATKYGVSPATIYELMAGHRWKE